MKLSNVEVPYRIQRIRFYAKQNKWVEIDHQENIGMLRFEKEDAKINVYYTRMTVTTCIDHPKKGKTQLFRRNVDYKKLDAIFKKPRVHTGLGYYTK